MRLNNPLEWIALGLAIGATIFPWSLVLMASTLVAIVLRAIKIDIGAKRVVFISFVSISSTPAYLDGDPFAFEHAPIPLLLAVVLRYHNVGNWGNIQAVPGGWILFGLSIFSVSVLVASKAARGLFPNPSLQGRRP